MQRKLMKMNKKGFIVNNSIYIDKKCEKFLGGVK